MWYKSEDSYHSLQDVVDFHISTIHTESNMSGNAIRRRYKEKGGEVQYDFALKDLWDEDYSLNMSLETALSIRRTSWEFGNRFDIPEIVKLLHLSLGVTKEMQYGPYVVKKKAYASAGAEYAVKPYMILKGFNHDLLDNKILEYNNEDEAFRVIDEADNRRLNSICSMTKFTEQNLINAKCVIFFVTDLSVLLSKYGRISYRLALIEAGHMCQNMQLVASALGLCSVPLGGYYDNYIKDLLKLKNNQYCLYVLAVG